MLGEFRTDGEFYNSIYGDYVAHVSHNIEYGKIFFTESFDKSGSFNPVLGMGYSFSYFQLRNDSPSEYNSTSSTQGFYYFIELSGRSSGVEHNLAKVRVEGSNPFARSKSFFHLIFII